MIASLLMTIGCACLSASQPSDSGIEWARVERGYWLHASLGLRTIRGYWSPDAAPEKLPTEAEVRAAAALLTGEYAANCLYLIYHGEMATEDFERTLRYWRQSCPRDVEIVPTLVLRMYDKNQTAVFPPEQLRKILLFCRSQVNECHIGWYDVMPDRPQVDELGMLAQAFPKGVIRVGIQPEEKIDANCCRVVQDTWSGLCHGKTHADWASPGFGRDTLSKWIDFRRGAVPVSWDLIVVAWDYLPTQRGEYPGYDDDSKNMPLPAGRNWLAARLIADRCEPKTFAGYSSDLFIIQANSRNPAHDGLESSFYATLRRGKPYRGYYAAAFDEVTAIFRHLRRGVPVPPVPLADDRPTGSRPAR